MSNEDLIKQLATLIDTHSAPPADTEISAAKILGKSMTAENFIKKLSELMDTDVVLTLATKLSDVEDWDSLSMVSFFSFCSTQGRTVTADEIKSAQTVEDLFKLATGNA